METMWIILITVILVGVAISALLDWLQKRKNRKDEWL